MCSSDLEWVCDGKISTFFYLLILFYLIDLTSCEKEVEKFFCFWVKEKNKFSLKLECLLLFPEHSKPASMVIKTSLRTSPAEWKKCWHVYLNVERAAKKLPVVRKVVKKSKKRTRQSREYWAVLTTTNKDFSFCIKVRGIDKLSCSWNVLLYIHLLSSEKLHNASARKIVQEKS